MTFPRIVTLATAALFLSGCTLLSRAKSGLNVVSNVPATVYLDGKDVGPTPYDGQDLQVKKYTFKLQPTDTLYSPYETSIRMGAGVQAAVDWSFGKSTEESKGIVLEIEKSQKKGAAELEIVTNPDNVPVTINNESKGFSPLLVDSLAAGQYTLSFQAPGYEQFVRNVNLLEGKRVVVNVKLAKKPAPTPVPQVASESAALAASASASTATPKASAKPTASVTPKPRAASASATVAKPYVEILDTPTGFLRVRDLPSSTGKELGQVQPGATIPYAGQTQNNWYKIVYNAATTSAWVSGQYAKLVQ